MRKKEDEILLCHFNIFRGVTTIWHLGQNRLKLMISRTEEVKTTDILPRKHNVDYVGITVMKVLNAHFFHSA